MTLEEKIKQSKNNEEVDFTKIMCSEYGDPLVPVVESDKIIIRPVWKVEGDLEGSMYAEYIKNNPEYDTVYVRSN